MSLVSRLDRYQQTHRWLGMPLAVVYKFADDQGNYLTAMITYYGFLSLFPLLLLLVTILGFALAGDASLQARVLDSALRQFPIIGDQIQNNVHSFHGSTFGLVVGVVGSVYGSLGVAQATQAAMNRAWGVPRHARPNPLNSRLRSLLMLATVGVGVLVTSGLSGLTTAAEAFGSDVGAGVRVAALVLSTGVNLTLFFVAYSLLTARRLSLRQVAAGAIVAGVVWQILQWLGTYYLAHMLRGASATYGLFGIVLGLLAWIYLGALILVLGAEINVVRARHLWPRSLLAPFTDNVALTDSDRRAYASYATTEGHKTFQHIAVAFDDDPAGTERRPDGAAANDQP